MIDFEDSEDDDDDDESDEDDEDIEQKLIITKTINIKNLI